MSTEGRQLKSYVERIERMNETISEMKQDRAEIISEAKGNGYDTKAILAIVKERSNDPEVQKQFDLIVDLYRRNIADAERESETKMSIHMEGRDPVEFTAEDIGRVADALEPKPGRRRKVSAAA